MNKKDYTKSKFNVGDLIAIENTFLMGLIIAKNSDRRHEPLGNNHFYKIQFCEDDTPDQRWIPEETLRAIK